MREDIALALDGSAILLVAVGLWLAFQRRRWAAVGVLFGVVGLAVMSGTAALRAYPNPTRAALHETEDALRADLAVMTDKWRKAAAVAEELEQKLLRAEEKGREIEKQLTAEVEAKLVLTKTVEALRGELEEARSETEKARSQTDKIRSDALSRVKGMMSVGLSTKFYQIAILPDRELVAGKSGTYFSVRLTDHATGAQFIFPKGRYSMPGSEAAILDAIAGFAEDIVHTLQSAGDYQIFIRGGADAEPLAGPAELSPEYAAITYRPLSGGKYAAELSEQSFRLPISNADLPVLRAAFFRSVIATRLSGHQLEILHNMPSERFAHEDRTVELILYVNW